MARGRLMRAASVAAKQRLTRGMEEKKYHEDPSARQEDRKADVQEDREEGTARQGLLGL